MKQLLLAFLFLPILAFAQAEPAASAASAPSAPPRITYNSTCGDPGYGMQWVASNGRATDEAHAREGEPGKHVNSDGYWANCTMPAPPPPPKDCKATVQSPTWVEGDLTCSSLQSQRAITHGNHAFYLKQSGLTRGQLIEQCVDGARVQVAVTCRPATHCSTEFAVVKGTTRYVYDGRRPGAAVPIGSSTYAVAPNGQRWPVACIAGEWVAPGVLPRPEAKVADRPVAEALPGCGPQAVNRNGLTGMYTGPRVAEGATATVRMGMRYVVAYCSAGKLTFDPPALAPGQAASAAEEWRSRITFGATK